MNLENRRHILMGCDPFQLPHLPINKQPVPLGLPRPVVVYSGDRYIDVVAMLTRCWSYDAWLKNSTD